ncbi:Piso0_001255 [Millerozyma farinosa CBS 7064]|uniref:Piso0_001255 protein n=1 Tax=Pichia sorbitophila (strain ATCC MYA-4447 / BCRC 22081 / CBS 7064 / NBRC 10061 / NRRL Y-12695) TaxID=559304 RepID=G8YMN7_PICSO|nr:Piso0_001255 [Millerozyma farinosa CBS 7064]
MSLGTLFVTQHARSAAPRALAKHFNLDVKLSDWEDPAYKANFPLAKVPAFLGPKGFKLHEIIAVTLYLVNSADPNSKLLGKNKEEYALIMKWLSLSNSELLPALASTFGPLIGKQPYNKKQVDEGSAYSNKVAAIFEQRLINFTYLVGERLTLADIFAATMFTRGFDYLYGTQWRKEHPGITRWFKTIIQSDILKDEFKNYQFREKPVEFVPPKKEKKAAQQPKENKAKEVKPEQPAQAPKPKHPLEALGKPKISLEDWKRFYSNEETREVSIPHFWEKVYDPSEWSLWKVDYKYNDELTLTFMSNNLVGGFFNRLSASTKYLFGCMVVYGENNNNGITGFFMVRGDDHVPAFNVAPDWESYSFEKLDDNDEKTRKFVNNMLAWDEPVIVNGEPKEIVDGKVLK